MSFIRKLDVCTARPIGALSLGQTIGNLVAGQVEQASQPTPTDVANAAFMKAYNAGDLSDGSPAMQFNGDGTSSPILDASGKPVLINENVPGSGIAPSGDNSSWGGAVTLNGGSLLLASNRGGINSPNDQSGALAALSRFGNQQGTQTNLNVGLLKSSLLPIGLTYVGSYWNPNSQFLGVAALDSNNTLQVMFNGYLPPQINGGLNSLSLSTSDASDAIAFEQQLSGQLTTHNFNVLGYSRGGEEALSFGAAFLDNPSTGSAWGNIQGITKFGSVAQTNGVNFVTNYYTGNPYSKYFGGACSCGGRGGVVLGADAQPRASDHGPPEPDALRRVMAPVHRRYEGHIHARLKRTGHFWQGRFGWVAMDEDHPAAALRYVALNPVRARLVERASDWRWSSVHVHLG